MKSKLMFVIPATVLGAMACASVTPPPIPVIGTRAAIDSLAGEWRGSYSSPAAGRDGTITFILMAGRDTANGEVIMIPSAFGVPMQPVESRVGEPRPLPRVLTITFVRTGDGRVRGTLDEYIDPDCECAMYAWFTGTFTGPDKIAGTFETVTRRDDRVMRGEWSVTRVPRRVAAKTSGEK
jgi:hypothetical protein